MTRARAALLASAALALVASSAGCKRAPRTSSEPAAGTAPSASPGEIASIFSAPVAGAQVGGGEAIAVGLVIASHALVAARVDAEGRARWTRTVIPGAAWSPDAELHTWPIAAGAVVTWRGPVNGKTAHLRVTLAPDGSVIEGPADVGSLACSTDDGLAWSDGPSGKMRLRVKAWGGAGRDEASEPITDDFVVACGARRAYAVVEGDEGTPTRVVGVGGGTPLAITLPKDALGQEEERDLFPWATGDDFGLVRVSNAGALGAVEIVGGAIKPLRVERARVPPEDDVVAIDADARVVTLVTTHDESEACPNGLGGTSVHATRIPRHDGTPSVRKLAPAACGSDAGPFWTEPLAGGTLVGWAERASRGEKASKAAPIAALDWRLLGDAPREGRIARPADAVADAGCDAARCYAVALARPAGADGMSPEAIVVVAYP